MRVDFYHLTRDPAEAVLPRLAENTLKAGERLLVVAGDDDQLARLSQALWTQTAESFLAHGRLGEPHEERQPILLGQEIRAANQARYLALADGVWRPGVETFARVFFLFDAATLDAARDCWRQLKGGVADRHYWKQEGRRWVEGG